MLRVLDILLILIFTCNQLPVATAFNEQKCFPKLTQVKLQSHELKTHQTQCTRYESLDSLIIVSN